MSTTILEKMARIKETVNCRFQHGMLAEVPFKIGGLPGSAATEADTTPAQAASSYCYPASARNLLQAQLLSEVEFTGL